MNDTKAESVTVDKISRNFNIPNMLLIKNNPITFKQMLKKCLKKINYTIHYLRIFYVNNESYRIVKESDRIIKEYTN